MEYMSINPQTITIQGDEVKIKQYLPVSDKIDLIDIALQESRTSNDSFNEVKLNMYFELFLVYFYSDIQFTDAEKADPCGTYDKLSQSGIIDKVIDAIPNEEYETIYSYMVTQVAREEKLNGTMVQAVKDFMDRLPAQMEQVAEIINTFDPEKYQNVIDFATAANGGRNINTNQPVEPTE